MGIRAPAPPRNLRPPGQYLVFEEIPSLQKRDIVRGGGDSLGARIPTSLAGFARFQPLRIKRNLPCHCVPSPIQSPCHHVRSAESCSGHLFLFLPRYYQLPYHVGSSSSSTPKIEAPQTRKNSPNSVSQLNSFTRSDSFFSLLWCKTGAPEEKVAHGINLYFHLAGATYRLPTRSSIGHHDWNSRDYFSKFFQIIEEAGGHFLLDVLPDAAFTILSPDAGQEQDQALAVACHSRVFEESVVPVPPSSVLQLETPPDRLELLFFDWKKFWADAEVPAYSAPLFALADGFLPSFLPSWHLAWSSAKTVHHFQMLPPPRDARLSSFGTKFAIIEAGVHESLSNAEEAFLKRSPDGWMARVSVVTGGGPGREYNLCSEESRQEFVATPEVNTDYILVRGDRIWQARALLTNPEEILTSGAAQSFLSNTGAGFYPRQFGNPSKAGFVAGSGRGETFSRHFSLFHPEPASLRPFWKKIELYFGVSLPRKKETEEASEEAAQRTEEAAQRVPCLHYVSLGRKDVEKHLIQRVECAFLLDEAQTADNKKYGAPLGQERPTWLAFGYGQVDEEETDDLDLGDRSSPRRKGRWAIDDVFSDLSVVPDKTYSSNPLGFEFEAETRRAKGSSFAEQKALRSLVLLHAWDEIPAAVQGFEYRSEGILVAIVGDSAIKGAEGDDKNKMKKSRLLFLKPAIPERLRWKVDAEHKEQEQRGQILPQKPAGGFVLHFSNEQRGVGPPGGVSDLDEWLEASRTHSQGLPKPGTPFFGPLRMEYTRTDKPLAESKTTYVESGAVPGKIVHSPLPYMVIFPARLLVYDIGAIDNDSLEEELNGVRVDQHTESRLFKFLYPAGGKLVLRPGTITSRVYLAYWGAVNATSEVITPRPVTPTFGYTKENLRRTMWVRGFTTSAGTSLGGVSLGGVSWGGGCGRPYYSSVAPERDGLGGRVPGRVSEDVSRGEGVVRLLHYVGGCILSSRTWE